MDEVKAYMWFSVAASLGHADAANELKVYESIIGFRKIRKAKKLAKLCIEKNYKDC